MRDANRIEPTLSRIAELWKNNVPDWRFGQLLYNFLAVYGDPFYLEDDDFIVALEAFFRNEDPRMAVRKEMNFHSSENSYGRK